MASRWKLRVFRVLRPRFNVDIKYTLRLCNFPGLLTDSGPLCREYDHDDHYAPKAVIQRRVGHVRQHGVSWAIGIPIP